VAEAWHFFYLERIREVDQKWVLILKREEQILKVPFFAYGQRPPVQPGDPGWASVAVRRCVGLIFESFSEGDKSVPPLFQNPSQLLSSARRLLSRDPSLSYSFPHVDEADGQAQRSL